MPGYLSAAGTGTLQPRWEHQFYLPLLRSDYWYGTIRALTDSYNEGVEACSTIADTAIVSGSNCAGIRAVSASHGRHPGEKITLTRKLSAVSVALNATLAD